MGIIIVYKPTYNWGAPSYIRESVLVIEFTALYNLRKSRINGQQGVLKTKPSIDAPSSRLRSVMYVI